MQKKNSFKGREFFTAKKFDFLIFTEKTVIFTKKKGFKGKDFLLQKVFFPEKKNFI